MTKIEMMKIDRFKEGFEATIWDFGDSFGTDPKRFGVKIRRQIEPGVWHEPWENFERFSDAVHYVADNLRMWEDQTSEEL